MSYQRKANQRALEHAMHISKGRKYSVFHMKTPGGTPMAGVGYYPLEKGAKERVIISKEGLFQPLKLGEDVQDLLNKLRERQGPSFYFNPQCALTQESINLGADFSVGEQKPYPWRFLLEEKIVKVERSEGAITLGSENGMRMQFEAATGILLEQSYPGATERKMKLISRKKLDKFDPETHALPAKPGRSAVLENMAKGAFSECHKLVTMVAGGWLLQVPKEKQAEKLENLQKALNQYYRKIVKAQPFLRDPMGFEVILKNSAQSGIDNMLKKVEAAGKDLVEFLKAERARCVETILGLAPKFAQRLSAVKLYRVDPERFNPKERPSVEKILHAQKLAILRALFVHVMEEEIDKRIGQN
jgi:hypothetical protein